MNTYQGLHARLYDDLYAEKPYAAEARFVADELAREGIDGGRLLDVACGTGRHAAEFARFGFDVTGVDYGAGLLELARERSPGIEFVLADMRELDLGRREFDAITCLFDSIGYPQTDDGVIAALAAARAHLAQHGVHVAEFLHAPAMLAAGSPVRVRRLRLEDDTTLVRISETELDRDRHLMHVDYELLLLHPDGTYERAAERQSNRFFDVDEMEDLLGRAGLEPIRFVPAYQPGEVREDTWHVLAVSRRA